jgi:hypothetical protein
LLQMCKAYRNQRRCHGEIPLLCCHGIRPLRLTKGEFPIRRSS